jgi:hypothetical protein
MAKGFIPQTCIVFLLCGSHCARYCGSYKDGISTPSTLICVDHRDDMFTYNCNTEQKVLRNLKEVLIKCQWNSKEKGGSLSAMRRTLEKEIS